MGGSGVNLIVSGFLLPILLAVLGWWFFGRRRTAKSNQERLQAAGFFLANKNFAEQLEKTKLKSDYYQGLFSSNRFRFYLSAVVQGIPIERERMKDVLVYVEAQQRSTKFIHVNIFGGKSQGKRTLLYQIALALAGKHGFLVILTDDGSNVGDKWPTIQAYAETNFLWWKPPWLIKGVLGLGAHLRRAIARHFGPAKIGFFAKIIQVPSRLIRLSKLQRIARFGHHRWLAIVVDDFSPTTGPETFLRQASEPSGRVLLVTATSDPLGKNNGEFELLLTPQDEENLVHTLRDEEPRLIPPGVTVEDIRGKAGGYRLYGNDFAAFMTILLQEAGDAETRGYSQLLNLLDVGSLDERNKRALCFVAACGLVDLAVPAAFLNRSIDNFDRGLLLEQTRGWLQEEGISLGPNLPRPPGYRLGAAFYAAQYLKKFNVSDGNGLLEIYEELFSPLARPSESIWQLEELEWARHLIYRLAKERHFRFGVSSTVHPRASALHGVSIAARLFLSYEQSFVSQLDNLRDTDMLCSWVATLVRIQDYDKAAKLCSRVLSSAQGTPKDSLSGQAFVSLTMALSKSHLRHLREQAIRTLDVEGVLAREIKQSALGRETQSTRLNETLHSYGRLLQAGGSYKEALQALEQVREFKLDGLCLCLKAEVLAQNGELEEADDAFRAAVQMALTETRRAPGVVVVCHQAYAKYLSEKRDQIDQALQHLQSALGYLSYAPERGESLWRDYVRVLARVNPQEAETRLRETLKEGGPQGISVRTLDELVGLIKKSRAGVGNSENHATATLVEDIYRKTLAKAIQNGDSGACRAILRRLAAQISGGRPYAYANKSRPDFDEAAELFEQAFESDGVRRDNVGQMTFDDAQVHLELARLFWRRVENPTDTSERLACCEQASSHFKKAFAGFPRENPKPRIFVHVIRARRGYAQFKKVTLREQADDDCLQILRLIVDWRKQWNFESRRMESDLQFCVQVLMEQLIGSSNVADIDIDAWSQAIIGVLADLPKDKRLFHLIHMATSIQSIVLSKSSEQNKAMALALLSKLLERLLAVDPSDVQVAEQLSRWTLWKPARYVEGFQRRVAAALCSATQALCKNPQNAGAIESALWLGDSLTPNNNSRREAEELICTLLKNDEHVRNTLQTAISRSRRYVPGAFGQRLLREGFPTESEHRSGPE